MHVRQSLKEWNYILLTSTRQLPCLIRHGSWHTKGCLKCHFSASLRGVLKRSEPTVFFDAHAMLQGVLGME